MVLVQIQQLSIAKIMLQSASKLAFQLGKEFAVLTNDPIDAVRNVLIDLGIADYVLFEQSDSTAIVDFCEEKEVSFLFLQLADARGKSIRKMLSDCRGLRIPYIFFKDSFTELNLDKVILPVGFLEEELEKAQFASAFGRFCGSEIKMLLANDYGSKASTNAGRMISLFDKFDFRYTLDKATKDSFKVETESIQVAEKEHAGIIIVSASRDYGLDDILFGPKEYHVVRKSEVPVLLVNPRGDLYALCD
jgi:Universal stress protein UspA and related nucleotide-binding proteins